jgi:TetR/AcrR family transcriptional repressor of nem operon
MTKKLTNRDRILSAGLITVLHFGYGGASVRDIVQAAGVPQGSFTNHFTSKEAFGLEILDIYYAETAATLRQTLRNAELKPLARLRAYLLASRRRQERDGVEHGCLFGNLAGEAVDQSEAIRARLVEIFAEIQAALAACLEAAVEAGELAKGLRAEQVAGFIGSGLQGAVLLAKVERSMVPLERFEQLLFGMVLGRPDALWSVAGATGATGVASPA